MSDVIGPATERMFDFPFAQDFRQEVLEQSRAFHERLLQQAPGAPELRCQMALIHRRLGLAAHQIGQDPEPELRRSVAILDDLAEEFPSNAGYREELSKAHGLLSFCIQSSLKLEEAVRQRRISLEIMQDLAAEFPSNEEYRQSVLEGHHQLGRRLTGIGRFDEAEEHHQAVLTDDNRLTPLRRVWNRKDYAYLLVRLARYEDADHVLQDALRISDEELAPNASPPKTDWGLNSLQIACCHNRAGLLDLYRGRLPEAEQQMRQAIGTLTLLSDYYPSFVFLVYYLGCWHHDLAEVLTLMGRMEEAEEARCQSLEAWESVDSAVRATFPYGKGLAHYRLGELLHETGRTEEARKQFVQAQAIMEDLAALRPNESICHWQLILLLANCPDAQLRDPQRAVELAKHVLPKQAGHYWRYLALAQYRSDQWQDAADSIQQAMDLRQGGDAFDWLLLAMTHWQLGQKDEAIQWYTKAQEAIETGKPLFYEYVGVMAVQRLRSEAETLFGGQMEKAGEET